MHKNQLIIQHAPIAITVVYTYVRRGTYVRITSGVYDGQSTYIADQLRT